MGKNYSLDLGRETRILLVAGSSTLEVYFALVFYHCNGK